MEWGKWWPLQKRPLNLCAENLDNLGSMLQESWQLKKQMTSGITNCVIDQAYQAAIEAGAEGGKVLGAGDGGFLMFLRRRKNIKRSAARFSQCGKHHFTFAPQGSSIIFVH